MFLFQIFINNIIYKYIMVKSSQNSYYMNVVRKQLIKLKKRVYQDSIKINIVYVFFLLILIYLMGMVSYTTFFISQDPIPSFDTLEYVLFFEEFVMENNISLILEEYENNSSENEYFFLNYNEKNTMIVLYSLTFTQSKTPHFKVIGKYEYP